MDAQELHQRMLRLLNISLARLELRNQVVDFVEIDGFDGSDEASQTTPQAATVRLAHNAMR